MSPNIINVVSLLKKIRKPAGFAILLMISLAFAFLVKKSEIKGAAIVAIMIVAPPVVYAIIAYARFGVLFLLVAAYLLLWVGRMNITSFPLGTLMDGFLALLILGFFIRQKYENDWTYFKNSISIIIIIWILYNFLQFFNPSALSRVAWVYSIRVMAMVMLTYFIFVFTIRTTTFLRLILKVWIGLSLFAALYAFKQQYFGFFGFEEAYLYSDPRIMDLLFIGGQWRKFSIFTDPTTFSYNMIISSLLCTGLLFSPISISKKILLSVFIILFMMSMLFSGTRSAYVLMPAAIILLTILIFNKRMIAISVVAGLIMAVIIFIPTGNPTLYRFQSAFKPTNDASFQVRSTNQKIIQPYIRSHPLGGGLGSTGHIAAKFSPGTFLATFPTDSGYVRVAIETGWIGLLIFCTLFFIILREGIRNYYVIKDPELKSYCLSMVLITFAIVVGNYPQEAVNQYPSNVYFFLVAAIINITRRIDLEKQASKSDLQKS